MGDGGEACKWYPVQMLKQRCPALGVDAVQAGKTWVDLLFLGDFYCGGNWVLLRHTRKVLDSHLTPCQILGRRNPGKEAYVR